MFAVCCCNLLCGVVFAVGCAMLRVLAVFLCNSELVVFYCFRCGLPCFLVFVIVFANVFCCVLRGLLCVAVLLVVFVISCHAMLCFAMCCCFYCCACRSARCALCFAMSVAVCCPMMLWCDVFVVAV